MADELFALDDDDQDDTPVTTPDPEQNPNFVAMRRALKAEKKARAEAEARVAAFELKERAAGAKQAFAAAGLPPKAAELFLRVNPEAEVTDEAVKNFVAEYDFLKPPAPVVTEGEEGESTEVPTGESGFPVVDGIELDTGTAPDLQARLSRQGVVPDFVPVAGGTTDPGKKISVGEFQKIYAKEGIKAMRLVREGRVDLPDGEQANI